MMEKGLITESDFGDAIGRKMLHLKGIASLFRWSCQTSTGPYISSEEMDGVSTLIWDTVEELDQLMDGAWKARQRGGKQIKVTAG